MSGRADRKFCSPACRQKAYRQRDQPTTRTPAAEPFPTCDEPNEYTRIGEQDPFWMALRVVHNAVEDLSPAYEDGVYPINLNPPVRRRGDDEGRQDDIRRSEIATSQFLKDYDHLIETLGRARATVELIREHNGWE